MEPSVLACIEPLNVCAIFEARATGPNSAPALDLCFSGTPVVCLSVLVRFFRDTLYCPIFAVGSPSCTWPGLRK